MHPNKPANVISLHQRANELLYGEVLELAELIRCGELTSLSYSAITRHGTTVEGVLGRAKEDVTRAHYGVARLAVALLAMAAY